MSQETRVKPQLIVSVEDTAKFVCGTCVQEPFLNQQKILILHRPRICVGCGSSVKSAFTLTYLEQQCRLQLPNHYEPDDEIYRRPEYRLEQLLGDVLMSKSSRLISLLAETLTTADSDKDDDADADADDGDDDTEDTDFFNPYQSYQRQSGPFEDEDHERWFVLGDWHHVATELSHGRRFFNPSAQKLFAAIVSEALSAVDDAAPARHPAIKTLPVGQEFFRARIALNYREQKDFREHPGQSLGAPPKEKASNGRMSAAGVSSLYMSADKKTCIAEVRPSIGDHVVVGKFKSTRELTLFDLTTFSEDGATSRYVGYPSISIFDPTHTDREMMRLMLSHLHVELGRPVKLQNTDYLMTQALAEYIRYYDSGRFDGIAFHSVQKAGGVNYTLFDRNTEDEQRSYGWEPRFDVEIDTADTEVVEVKAVEYLTKHKPQHNTWA